jgi:hypothetical protein
MARTWSASPTSRSRRSELQPREGASWMLVRCHQRRRQAIERTVSVLIPCKRAHAAPERTGASPCPSRLGSWHARLPPVAAPCSTRAAHACRRCPGWTKANGAQQPSAPAGMVLRQLQAEGRGARAAWRPVGVAVRSRGLWAVHRAMGSPSRCGVKMKGRTSFPNIVGEHVFTYNIRQP